MSRGTQDTGLESSHVSPTGLSPPVAGRSRPFGYPIVCGLPYAGPTTPITRRRSVWAAPRSLATTRGIISFPRGTEMFQFPRFPPSGLCVQPEVTRHNPGRVAPFGYPRFSLLDSSPRLFAVLPRPSSAPDAKASTVRP